MQASPQGLRGKKNLRSKSSNLHLNNVSVVSRGSSPEVLKSRERFNFLRNGKYDIELLRLGACIRPGFPQRFNDSKVFSCMTRALRNKVTILSVKPQRASSKPRKWERLDAAASTSQSMSDSTNSIPVKSNQSQFVNPRLHNGITASVIPHPPSGDGVPDASSVRVFLFMHS